MGSDDKAVITGFICRLCSRMNRFVIHIYGDEGVQMQLAQKINIYLPITVNPSDPLPKTVCLQCIDSLEAQHELMEQFKWARQRVQRLAKGEQGVDDCRRDHPSQTPDDIRGPHLTSVLARPPLIARSSRPAGDGSARPSSETPTPSPSTGIELNTSLSELP